MKKGLLNSFKYENEEVEILDTNCYGYTVKLNNGKILDGINKSAITIIENTNLDEIVINNSDEEIHVNSITKKVMFVKSNNRIYKSTRYINNFYYKSIVNEYFKNN